MAYKEIETFKAKQANKTNCKVLIIISNYSYNSHTKVSSQVR